MSLLAIALFGGIIVGFLIGVLVGSNNAKKVKTAIEDVKTSVDGVHVKNDSVKDDIIALEGKVKSIIDFIQPFVEGREKEITSKLEDFGKEQLKEINKIEEKVEEKIKGETPAPVAEKPAEVQVAGQTAANPLITVN